MSTDSSDAERASATKDVSERNQTAPESRVADALDLTSSQTNTAIRDMEKSRTQGSDDAMKSLNNFSLEDKNGSSKNNGSSTSKDGSSKQAEKNESPAKEREDKNSNEKTAGDHTTTVEADKAGKEKGSNEKNATPKDTAAKTETQLPQLELIDNGSPATSQGNPAADSAAAGDVQQGKGIKANTTRGLKLIDTDAGGEEVKPREGSDPNAAVVLRTQPESIDPSKRNALVVDSFNSGDGKDFDTVLGTRTHGGFIGEGLRDNGFNVFTADNNAPNGKLSDNSDFGAVFKDIAKKIDSGELPLKQGDIVTASFGNNVGKDTDGNPVGGDPTFADASKLLKMDITPGSIKGQTDEIINRLGKVGQGLDPVTGEKANIDPKDQEMAKLAFETNQGIQELQKRGITVISAAGNDGADRVSLGFLSAVRLSSADQNGKVDGFSASDSCTINANGVIPIFATSPGLLNPQPLARQTEQVQVGENGRIVNMNANPFETKVFHRDQLGPAFTDNTAVLQAAPPPSFDGQQSLGFVPESGLSQKFGPLPRRDSGFNNRERPGDLSKVVYADVKTASPDAVLQPGPKRLIGVDPGTSFSVINFTKGKANRDVPLL